MSAKRDLRLKKCSKFWDRRNRSVQNSAILSVRNCGKERRLDCPTEETNCHPPAPSLRPLSLVNCPVHPQGDKSKFWFLWYEWPETFETTSQRRNQVLYGGRVSQVRYKCVWREGRWPRHRSRHSSERRKAMFFNVVFAKITSDTQIVLCFGFCIFLRIQETNATINAFLHWQVPSSHTPETAVITRNKVARPTRTHPFFRYRKLAQTCYSHVSPRPHKWCSAWRNVLSAWCNARNGNHLLVRVFTHTTSCVAGQAYTTDTFMPRSCMLHWRTGTASSWEIDSSTLLSSHFKLRSTDRET